MVVLPTPPLQASAVPPLSARFAIVSSFASEVRALGPANFLYSDGDALFAHGHRRKHAETGKIEAPGLVLLQRQCEQGGSGIVVSGLSVRRARQEVTLFASVQLKWSGGNWRLSRRYWKRPRLEPQPADCPPSDHSQLTLDHKHGREAATRRSEIRGLALIERAAAMAEPGRHRCRGGHRSSAPPRNHQARSCARQAQRISGRRSGRQ